MRDNALNLRLEKSFHILHLPTLTKFSSLLKRTRDMNRRDRTKSRAADG